MHFLLIAFFLINTAWSEATHTKEQSDNCQTKCSVEKCKTSQSYSWCYHSSCKAHNIFNKCQESYDKQLHEYFEAFKKGKTPQQTTIYINSKASFENFLNFINSIQPIKNTQVRRMFDNLLADVQQFFDAGKNPPQAAIVFNYKDFKNINSPLNTREKLFQKIEKLKKHQAPTPYSHNPIIYRRY